MSKVLASRIKAQDEAKEAIRNANYKAAIIGSVGFGKGKVLIDIAQELIEKKLVKSILYVCDNTRLRDSEVEGFPAELNKWGSPELKKIVTLECYQTTYKWNERHFDLILADEVDFAMTPKYMNVFFNNTFNYKVVVTGTLTPAKKKIVKEIAPIVYTCTTLDAEDMGIVNKSDYYIYNYRLNKFESKQYQKWTTKISRAIQSEEPQNTINFFTGKRANILYTSDSAYEHCRRIMGWLWKKDKNTRLIIFCQRTEQADRVCVYSYHGGNEKEDNLTRFQNGEISGLSVVAKIKRGINLKRANTAIFLDMTGSTTEFEQRNGRFKRLEVNERATVIFMLPWYCKIDSEGNETWKPTIVSTWIDNATKNLNIDFKELKI